jgi:hypothetical protein
VNDSHTIFSLISLRRHSSPEPIIRDVPFVGCLVHGITICRRPGTVDATWVHSFIGNQFVTVPTLSYSTQRR